MTALQRRERGLGALYTLDRCSSQDVPEESKPTMSDVTLSENTQNMQTTDAQTETDERSDGKIIFWILPPCMVCIGVIVFLLFYRKRKK